MLLQDYFHADKVRVSPEVGDEDAEDRKGYFLGSMTTQDNYELGFFYFDVGGKEGYDDDSLSQDYLWSNNEIEYLIRQKAYAGRTVCTDGWRYFRLCCTVC